MQADFSLLVTHVPRRDLGCEEDLFARDFGGTHGFRARLLVAVHPGGINVTIAMLEGVESHGLCDIGWTGM